jgi:hypothetical protein
MKTFSKKMPSTKGALQTNPPRHEKPLSTPGGRLVKGTLKLFNYNSFFSYYIYTIKEQWRLVHTQYDAIAEVATPNRMSVIIKRQANTYITTGQQKGY